MTEELSKALSDFAEAGAEFVRSFAEAAKFLLKDFAPWLPTLAAYKAAEIEHPKWVHMASHAKRKRIRKKYHDRIMREYGGESNGQA